MVLCCRAEHTARPARIQYTALQHCEVTPDRHWRAAPEFTVDLRSATSTAGLDFSFCRQTGPIYIYIYTFIYTFCFSGSWWNIFIESTLFITTLTQFTFVCLFSKALFVILWTGFLSSSWPPERYHILSLAMHFLQGLQENSKQHWMRAMQVFWNRRNVTACVCHHCTAKTAKTSAAQFHLC